MKDLANHKFKRVIKMDRRDRYSVICDKEVEVKNDLNSQLNKFKSTLNRGKIDENK